MLRARMTAEPIAQKLGLPVELSALLQERNFGDLRGVPYAELAENPFGPDFSPPNGESWRVFHERVADAFAMVCALRARLAGPLIVVTHGLVCRALVERHTAWRDAGPLPDKFHNTSVTMLDEGEPFVVRLTNCFAHLDQGDTDVLETAGRA
jgi:probable phosphoglycerate mutase